MSRNKAKTDEERKAPQTQPDRRKTGHPMHPAGPHARPDLTDPEATPGTGALPDVSVDKDVDPGNG
ncbi:MAG: hypothetical protein DIU57_006960 [Pseudomonadota bacterium]|jgi:hypothetical protein